VAVCLREEKPEVLDGFKRVAAAKTLPAVLSLQARLVEVDEPTAKAIILGLNGIGGRMKELEEAWIVQALVREDGLSQLQVAELLQRHKSWVCRRLALLERLSEECREDLRLGLLSPTMARQLTRLPAGNQMAAVRALEGLAGPGEAKGLPGAHWNAINGWVAGAATARCRWAVGGPSRRRPGPPIAGRRGPPPAPPLAAGRSGTR
jgi:hypothetical protein